MAKNPREVDKPGEMGSLNKKTGKYGDRWLCEELLGENLSGPPQPPSNEPIVNNSYDPNLPDPEYLPDESE